MYLEERAVLRGACFLQRGCNQRIHTKTYRQEQKNRRKFFTSTPEGK